MFETDILRELNLYKGHENIYAKEKAKRKIIELIRNNRDQYEVFKNSGSLEQWAKIFLQECEDASSAPTKDDINDIEIIKKAYTSWQREYNNNGNIPNKECEEIIEKIINFYINRYEIISQILKINDTEDYEAFKNMLLNYIRNYFVDKVDEYMATEHFKEQPFFVKRKKKKEILKLLDDLGKYEIDPKSISEVLR